MLPMIIDYDLFIPYVAASLMEAQTMPDQPDSLAISEFKATCLKVLDQVKKTGKSVLVTRRGEPLALVVPPPPPEPEPGWMGTFAGSARIAGDVVSPASDEDDWEALGR